MRRGCLLRSTRQITFRGSIGGPSFDLFHLCLLQLLLQIYPLVGFITSGQLGPKLHDSVGLTADVLRGGLLGQLGEYGRLNYVRRKELDRDDPAIFS